MSDLLIRPAATEDLPRLAEISRAADTLFASAGLDLPPDDPAEEFAAATWLLAAELTDLGILVGFAHLIEVDHNAHLHALGVHPDRTRRGIGGALLETALVQARERGFPALTLTTFRDVPFNAPWYARRGFEELPAERWGPELTVQWHREAETAGDAAPRVVMRRETA